MSISTATMDEKFHRSMVAWQEKFFPDYTFLIEHWGEFYRQAPFQLTAKFMPLKDDRMEVGARKGQPRARRVSELDAETLDRARAIIRAQTSTELGSIQQHRESLHKAQDPRIQFDVLRVMAEEYRHGYQMMYLLAADDWGGNVAQETIDELLSMTTGSHVLDAFNVYFDSFVDNIVFAAIIDRVGKYQLAMQKVFAYAPMAESMMPMLSEEAFHLATGVGPLKQWAREAARDEGNVSIPCIQKHLNKWVPRGLEMFGDERGGESNIKCGLKDLSNGEAQDRYHKECGEQVVDALNVEIVRTRLGKADLPPEEALKAANRVLLTGAREEGLGPDDLLRLPVKNFYRIRGVPAFERVDIAGKPFTDRAAYIRYLRTAFPDAYLAGRDFSVYGDNLRRRAEGLEVKEQKMNFYG